MIKLVILVAMLAYGFKLMSGRWPWEPRISTRQRAIVSARTLLGVSPAASRDDIIGAHRRTVTLVHPDRGGSNAQVHEANAARDLLLDALPSLR